MKSKRKYNRKNTLKMKNTRMRRRRSKKRKYSKRRKKMKGGSTGLLTGIKPSQLKILQYHNASRARIESRPEIWRPPPPPLPSVHETYSTSLDEIERIIDEISKLNHMDMKTKIAHKSPTEALKSPEQGGLGLKPNCYTVDKDNIGIISGHGILAGNMNMPEGTVERQYDIKSDFYHVIPEGINLIFYSSDSEASQNINVKVKLIKKYDDLVEETRVILDKAEKERSQVQVASLRGELIKMMEGRSKMRNELINMQQFRFYPEGSVCRDYLIDFDPGYQNLKFYRYVGVFGSPGRIHLPLDKDNFFIGLNRMIAGMISKSTSKFLTEEEKRKFLEDSPPTRFISTEDLEKYGKGFGGGSFLLSDILKKIYEAKLRGEDIPKYFICNFCRSHCKSIDKLPIEALKQESLHKIFQGEYLEKIPEDFFPEDTLISSGRQLKKNTSLTRPDVLRNFGKIIDEILLYYRRRDGDGEPNFRSAASDVKTIKDKDILTLRDIAYILQLRHTLSIRDVP
jgi:hypothetical protein